MKSITIFCGSSSGYDNIYSKQAYQLGTLLANNNIRIIYGGAKIGIMGDVARGALDHGGIVIGVIPDFLKVKEVVHEGLHELITVSSMHERKMTMHELSDAVLALPGGFGTLEELFEVLTWAQLGLHKKPIGVLNVNNFFQPLLDMIDSMKHSGFLKEYHHKMLIHHENINELIEKMKTYVAPPLEKWMKQGNT